MKKVTVVFAVIALMISTNLFAQNTDYEDNGWISHSDVEGSKDAHLISRFKGAIIQYYKVEKWNKYILPISKIENMEGQKGWKKKLDLAGEVNRIQYSTSKNNNPVFVAENYKNALKNAEWEILFSGCGDNELGNSSYEWCYYYYGSDGLNMGKFGDSFGPRGEKHCYIAAKYATNDTTYYTAVYISDHEEGPKGLYFTLITQDIIKVKNPNLGLVTAEILADKIDNKGHLALDGIYFETGKATLTSQSNPAFINIADYLNAHKDKKFFIVGHTDNVGNFASNMTLSENRAKAVVTELTTEYGVDPNQLKAYGIANLCTVASNKTDGGKARNRRVEIVEQ